MRDEPRVSVVVPLHAQENVEATVRSALASDLHQLEVLIVDNSSMRRSAEVAANVPDPRLVTVLVRPGRVSRALNVGIARARAPYVALLDPDDLIRTDKLSAAAQALDRHPEAGFAFADFEHIDASGRVTRPSALAGSARFQNLVKLTLEDSWQLIPQVQLARGLLHENFIGASAVILRKELLTEIGPFDESTDYGEHLDLWFRLGHSCNALYWNRVGHSYRDMGRSSTDTVQACSVDHIIVLQRERNRWNDRSSRRALDRRIARNVASVAYQARRNGQRLRSLAMFAYAFGTSPDVRWLRGVLGSMFCYPRSRPARLDHAPPT